MPLVLRWALIVIGCAAAHLGLAQSTDSCASAIQPDNPGGCHAATELRVFGPNPDGWLFPVTRLDELLPHWVQFGGQFRDGAEGQTGLSYAPVDDGYDLTQLRLGIYLQPSKWLELVGVTQDSAGLLQQARKGGTSLSKHLGHSGGVCADRQFDRRLGRSCGRTANVQLWGRARHRASDWSNMGHPPR